MDKSRTKGNLLFVIFWWLVQKLHIEWAHTLLYWGLRDGAFPAASPPDAILHTDRWGYHFDTPIGLTDGIDKRGNVLDTLLQMGFSFGSFGPYTLEKELPPREKYFLKQDKAVIVQCAGYRNPGLLKVLPWLIKRRYLPHFMGVDIAIPAENEESNIKQERHFTYVEEFTLMAQRAAPYCDYLTLDFSHPNSELCLLVVNESTILPIIKAAKDAMAQAAPIKTPKIFVKIPLDLNAKEVPLVAKTLLDGEVDGVVVAGPMSLAKNSRIKLKDVKEFQYSGMLTGNPTHPYLTELIRRLYSILKGRIPIIASGFVADADAAFELITAGANYIALEDNCLVYQGPGILQKVNKGLTELLKQKNFASLNDAVGSDIEQLEDTNPNPPQGMNPGISNGMENCNPPPVTDSTIGVSSTKTP